MLQVNRNRNFGSLLFLGGILSLFLPAEVHGQYTSYTISTIAGEYSAGAGYNGDNGRQATNAQLSSPSGVLFDSVHNILYIADTGNNRIRTVVSGKINTVAGDGVGGYSGDGKSATGGELEAPYALALDSSFNLYIADFGNEVVRQVTPSGIINTVAGDNTLGPGNSGDGGAATGAQLNTPAGVAVDSAGDLYIADTFNNEVKIVTPDGNINIFAGTLGQGYKSDGVPATSTSLYTPTGLALDAAGNLYIADSHDNRIRKVSKNGIIATVAGNGTPGYSGDGGPATKAEIDRPQGIAVDGNGNLFIADYDNSVIREVTTDGNIHTVAGNYTLSGYSGDGGAATSAALNYPYGVCVDTSGNVYIADFGNNVIRMLTPAAPAALTQVISASAFGALPAAAPGSWIEIYGPNNLAFDSRTWTGADFKGSTAPTQLDGTSVTVGGQPAYIWYISGSQLNVQVPSGVATGQQPVVVKSPSGSTAAFNVTVNATEPALWAPPAFKINGTQYVGATFSDGSFVLPPGAVAGLTSRRANPGDVITLWGIGFGNVTPNTPAGQIASGQTSLTASPVFSFAGTAAATPGYAGLAPGSVGLYQFNVTVPTVAASDAVPLTFTLNGASGAQTLYIAVQ